MPGGPRVVSPCGLPAELPGNNMGVHHTVLYVIPQLAPASLAQSLPNL